MSATYAREATLSYRRTNVLPDATASNGQAAAAYMRAALPTDDPREHFAVLALNTKHRIVGHYIVAVGTVDAALVHPREIFRFALTAGASSIVIGHTHPSGDTTPSPDDLTLTRRIMDAGALIGIPCVDHVIIGCTYGDPMPAPALSLRTAYPQMFQH